MYEPRTGLRRRGRGPLMAVAVAVAVLAALALWWLLRSMPPAPPPVATAPPPAPAPEPEQPVAPVDMAHAGPLLESISANPLVKRGLQDGDAVARRFAIVLDNLAEGVSPRKELAFLAPKRPFSVVERGGKSAIAPESYRRYDAFADAVSSVDAAAAAKAYRALHSVLQPAYRALGYPDASLDQVTARALRRIVQAPVRDGDVAVEPQEGLFAFSDPKLEGLGQVEKHLLRMGPRNTRAIQAKARELLDALGLAQAR